MKSLLDSLPTENDLASSAIVKELVSAHRHLAELKGTAKILPNEKILLTNLTLREAKDSSTIENIITTQDSLYKYQLNSKGSTADKEVYSYSMALEEGWRKVKSDHGISCNTMIKIQSIIEPKKPGLRKLPGTVIKDMATNAIVYTPPGPEQIYQLMGQLEHFINTNSMDPLIKMAITHHLFESIHPFYDGNGRTGRIVNILYLLLNNLLESPILYLSRYILRYKADYYRLLQQVRDQEVWEEWIIYMLRGVSTISCETQELIKKIDILLRDYKNIIRDNYKFYSHELINTIFCYPYTKAKFLSREINVSRATAARYLDELADGNILEKNKMGKENYYINLKLFNLLKDPTAMNF